MAPPAVPRREYHVKNEWPKRRQQIVMIITKTKTRRRKQEEEEEEYAKNSGRPGDTYALDPKKECTCT